MSFPSFKYFISPLRLLILSLLIFCRVEAAEVDFDDVFIGTSPICLLEALHRYHLGHRVLILEQADRCGGAWKSIEACGISNVDLGCHFIGTHPELAHFLQKHVGCPLIDLGDPLKQNNMLLDHSPQKNLGFYFPRGSIDLIENLLKLIEKTNIVLLLNHKLESVYIDAEHKLVRVKVKDGYYTTSKVVATPSSSLRIENLESKSPAPIKKKHYHLYLLIADPTRFKFTYHVGISAGMIRMMNLTPFAGLHETGHQLIAIETGTESRLDEAEQFLQSLKDKMLIGKDAYILQQQKVIYEHSHFNFASLLRTLPIAKDFIEVLDTVMLSSASKYLPQWRENMQLAN